MIHTHQQRNTKLYPRCYTEEIIVIQELGWVYNIKIIYQIYQPNILFCLSRKETISVMVHFYI